LENIVIPISLPVESTGDLRYFTDVNPAAWANVGEEKMELGKPPAASQVGSLK